MPDVKQIVVGRLNQVGPVVDGNAPVHRQWSAPRRRSQAPAAERRSRARSCESRRRRCRASTGRALRYAHFARDQADDFEIRLGAHGLDGALQPLHFAADVGDGAVLLVGARPPGRRRRRAAPSRSGTFLHHDERASARPADRVFRRIRADHPQHIQIGAASISS